MANKIRLRIVTPERQLYDNPVDMVILRGSEGDLGILSGHEPLTTTLDYGVMRIMNDKEEINAAILGGFVEIRPDMVTVLSDSAQWPDEIDKDRARSAKERAERRIKENKSDVDLLRAELALKRSLVRISVGSGK